MSALVLTATVRCERVDGELVYIVRIEAKDGVCDSHFDESMLWLIGDLARILRERSATAQLAT